MQRLSDSLTNIVSGLGTEKDKAANAYFQAGLMMSKAELDAIYQTDWIAGTIVDAPCDDMTREWRTWDAGQRQGASLRAEEKRLGVRQKVNQAMKLARLYGGSAILIGDGAPDPTKPLEVDAIGRGGVRYLHVLSRWELFASEVDRDPLSPFFGQPVYYEVRSPQTAARIHPSRIVRFVGQARLEMSCAVDGWGFSILDRMRDTVRNIAATAANVAGMTYEAKVDVISIPGLNENSVNPDYQAKVIARFALANRAKSIQNAIVIDAQEKWEQKTISFGGLVEVLNKQLEMAAGSAQMPVTRLLGVAPKGLNATGQSDTRNYYDMLSGRQEVELGPALAPLDEAIIRSAIGSRPANVTYQWAPLWQMTEAEKAAIGLQKAQTAQIYGTLGVMPPSAMRGAVQNQLMADGYYPGLPDLLATAKGVGEEAAPIASKAAQVGAEIDTPGAGAKVAKA